VLWNVRGMKLYQVVLKAVVGRALSRFAGTSSESAVSGF